MTAILDEARSRLGVQEIKGRDVNKEILQYFEDVGHPEITQDDSCAWCAAFAGSVLKKCNYPVPHPDVSLLARTYRTYGTPCDPQPGAIGVWPRGKVAWMGHVAFIECVNGDNTVRVIGGNQGKEGYGKVSRAEYPIDTALAFRMPVKATVQDLRKNGSSEVKAGDRLQNLGWFATIFSGIVATIKELLAPVTMPQFGSLSDQLTFTEQLLRGAHAVWTLIAGNPWLCGTVLAGVVLVWTGHRIKARRVAKAAAGVPLASQITATHGA